jgi:hypothetical protein
VVDCKKNESKNPKKKETIENTKKDRYRQFAWLKFSNTSFYGFVLF